MVDNQDRLLVEFEVRVHDLIALCEERKSRMDELTVLLTQKEKELKEAHQIINELNKKKQQPVDCSFFNV